ncbi:HAD family hydrolase [Aneurinibacillus thermoaerophilus]|uniref:HAD family hydrolase n=1 Tax=Aneurinibacillus thermoaerophilus TaxID=143495 RepID=UPI002E1AAF50|nr:HAD family hydrolase [Aneurinibacillus thermoaerophilus]MED0762815.1 HAD family hydrolase [Aneurinibacillus thermoaerophilus]
MKKVKYKYGIIFDMDNTLLQSRIDFTGMKQAIFRLLTEYELCAYDFEWKEFTASQLIEMARQSGRLRPEVEALIWEAVTEFEKRGMYGANLEPYVPEVLEYLSHECHLVVLTNNAQEAAQEALHNTGIAHYFDYIVGREQMTVLKPSPSGIHYILRYYPDVPSERWMLVGDSWIDGKAAQDSNIRFAAYKGNIKEMEKWKVHPVLHINDMRELIQSLVWKTK